MKVKAAAITPLPWHTDGHYCGYIWSGDKMVADFPMDEDEGTYLARMRGVGRGATHAEQQANAAFIVRAVNCHDQLVAALEAVRAWDRCSAGRTALWWEDVLAKVDTALAAAKVPQ